MDKLYPVYNGQTGYLLAFDNFHLFFLFENDITNFISQIANAGIHFWKI